MPPAPAVHPSPKASPTLRPTLPPSQPSSFDRRCGRPRPRATRRHRAVLINAVATVVLMAAGAVTAAITGSSSLDRATLTSAPDVSSPSTKTQSPTRAPANPATTGNDEVTATAAARTEPSSSAVATSTVATVADSTAATALGAPASAGSASSASGCTVSPILVPSCGAWWGVSPAGSDPASGVAEFERLTGARTDIYHGYHSIGEMFPTPKEIALARDPTGRRLLLLSLFMASGGETWKAVANGSEDAYLTGLATYIKANYRDKFFFTIHHEPENDVIPTAGSGMEATDFHTMFRHVVTFMKSHGVGNAVWVVNFQGTQKFKLEPWWPQMYPGDDVVDWVGWDSYSCVAVGPGTPCPDFSQIMNRRFSPTSPWLGMYHWASTNHPSKPIFICEVGVENPGDTRKATVLRTIGAQISSFPQIKAIAYWNSGDSSAARITYGPGAVAAAAATAQNTWFRQSPP